MVPCAAAASRRYPARHPTSPRSLRDAPSRRDADTSNLPAQPPRRLKYGMATRGWCAVSERLGDEAEGFHGMRDFGEALYRAFKKDRWAAISLIFAGS
jgi:hypothetical protein